MKIDKLFINKNIYTMKEKNHKLEVIVGKALEITLTSIKNVLKYYLIMAKDL